MKWTDIGAACTAVLVGIAVSGGPASAQQAPAPAQQKTAKQCAQEWTANKAAIQASGKTKKAFVAECRGQTAAAAPTQPTPAPAPTYSRQGAAQPTTTGRQRQTSTSPTGGPQFASEVQARAHCPSDTVVWVNLGSGVYHFSGARDYGHTKRGAYMCERDTAGFRAAKNEKHP